MSRVESISGHRYMYAASSFDTFEGRVTSCAKSQNKNHLAEIPSCFEWNFLAFSLKSIINN